MVALPRPPAPLLSLLISTLLLSSSWAAADTPPPNAPPPGSPSTAAPAAAAAPAAGSLDFDLFDQPKPDAAQQAATAAKVAEVERLSRIRRKVLLTHQALGFTTLAVMAAAIVVGQLNYNARYGSFNNGLDYDRFQTTHLGLTITSTTLFTALGILGVAAPNPYPKKLRADAAAVHKVAMILATAGMVTQMILGPITASYEGKQSQRNLALGHVITGYATYGFMTAGVLAFVF